MCACDGCMQGLGYHVYDIVVCPRSGFISPTADNNGVYKITEL